MPKLDNLLVYQWQAWDGYLISHLVADYCRIDACYDDDEHVFDGHISPNIRAVLMQINLSRSTHFPAQRAQIVARLRARGVRVFNQNPSDIRKTHLYRCLNRAGLPSAKAMRDGPEDEWLFVKSDLNWGGGPERRLPPDLPQAPRAALGDSLQSRHISRWDAYRKLRRCKIPDAYWSDPNTVIERYIANADACFYRVYGFGEALVFVQAHNRALIQKVANAPQDRNHYLHARKLTSPSLPIPAELAHTVRLFRQRIAPTYFCIDVLYDDQGFVIVDLNLTPYAGHAPQHARAAEFLRMGTDGLLSASIPAGDSP